MTILYLLIPISIVFVAFGIWALIWAIRNGQYDDLDGPAYRILMDDDDPRIPHPPKGADRPDDRAGGEPPPEGR
jgi:cbb3-type cytochrome oxidase maturation protein